MNSEEMDAELREAELKRLASEAARNEAEREKFEAEKSEITRQAHQRWWHIRVTVLIQAGVAGAVAGALLWGFALDHFLKLYDLNRKAMSALEVEKGKLERELEISRQNIESSQFENQEFSQQLAETRQQLADLQRAREENEELELFAGLAAFQMRLDDIESLAVQRTENLGAQLQGLAETQERLGGALELNWFPVVASVSNDVDLERDLKKLEAQSLDYEIHLYETADKNGVPVYAITLGGYLSKAEATRRVQYARSEGLSKDAYTWSSNRWGENLLEEDWK